jgi:TRAP-type uncharacterized transport system fused permease subunit
MIPGPAAFVMAEFLGIPYAQVAVAAVLPALLYYLALFVQVDLEAGKTGIGGSPRKSPRSSRCSRKDGFCLSNRLIVYLLFS